MAVFTIWEGGFGKGWLQPGGGPPSFADGRPIDPGAVKVLEFEAATMDEARQVQYDHYGWGKFAPDGFVPVSERPSPSP